MNLGRTVFAQLISFLPDREFRFSGCGCTIGVVN